MLNCSESTTHCKKKKINVLKIGLILFMQTMIFYYQLHTAKMQTTCKPFNVFQCESVHSPCFCVDPLETWQLVPQSNLWEKTCHNSTGFCSLSQCSNLPLYAETTNRSRISDPEKSAGHVCTVSRRCLIRTVIQFILTSEWMFCSLNWMGTVAQRWLVWSGNLHFSFQSAWCEPTTEIEAFYMKS